MARARNIKPGFYKNEDLAECSVWARLIFPGLWMLADRDGRLEDRPKRIKGELLPYDSQEIDPLLRELEARGFIVRYKNSDGSFIQITKFAEHQTPHYTEKPSAIKPPGFQESGGHEEQDKPRAPPENTGKQPPSRVGQNPLNPDSLNPDSLNQEPSVLVGKASPPRPPDCPTDDLIRLYHERLPMLPRVEVLNDSRRRALSARWREVVTDPEIRRAADPKSAALDWFGWYFEHASKSAFLTGRKGDWRADFDFLLTPSKFAKVVEGSYHKEHA